MAKKPSRQIVIDASIAQAAGPDGAEHPTSKYCRDFLKSILDICHRAVFSDAIKKEWKEHESNFSRRWRANMVARRKLETLEISPNQSLRDKIEKSAPSNRKRQAMLKDMLLIEASQKTDKIVASLDEKVRDLFSGASNNIGEIREIIWVNPNKPDEEVFEWLKTGAKPEEHRRLGAKKE